MHAQLSALFGLLLATAVSCAPMPSLDADIFLQNGKDAQVLNAEFAKLSASDSCNAGEMACIGSSVAHCVNGTWKEDACPKSLSCFALPSVREEGTVLSCTSNTTALAVISASGATGGIASNSTDDSVEFPMDCDDNDEEDDGDAQSTASSTAQSATATGTQTRSSASKAASASASATHNITRTAASSSASPSDTNSATGSAVTVTVTVAPTSFSTDFSETTTLDASQASSFLSSIATDTNFSIVTTIRGPAPTASASATASVSSNSSQNSVLSSKPVGIASAPAVGSFTSDVGAPTTITLLSGPASATTRAAAATSAEASPDTGYGYSY
ncbi:hypothetical protein OH77DRAFT_680880 [Trametes cingulata]|nr:hypothetical protein OH77DRAFT_680880 [Trametes cingulata]